VKPIRDNIHNSLSPPVLTYMALDNNRDGITDQYKIQLRIKKPLSNQALQQLNLIVAFDLQLTETTKMKMEGIAFVNLDLHATKTLSASKIMT
jgi:hypothetical protein